MKVALPADGERRGVPLSDTCSRCKRGLPKAKHPHLVDGKRVFVKAFAVSTGFDMPMRALSFFERDASGPPQAELALESSP